MVISKESDFRQFAGASASEIGFGPEKVHTEVLTYTADSGQRIGLTISEPHDGYDKTIIMPQQHEYRNEPLSVRRAEILASNTNSRVALVETPGTVGLILPDPDSPEGYKVYDSLAPLEGVNQTSRQLRAAMKGDFSEHTEVQINGLTEALRLTDSNRLVIFGESMGVVGAKELARHMAVRGLRLSDIILHESASPAGNQSLGWLFSSLANVRGIESKRRDEYFAENEYIGHPLVAFEQTSEAYKKLDSARKSLRQQGFGGLANGLGLRVGLEEGLVDTLHMFGNNRPNVILTRGQQSTISHRTAYGGLRQRLSETFGAEPISWELVDREKVQDIGHFSLFSLARQTMYVQQLNELLN